jgi:hypothetical protein
VDDELGDSSSSSCSPTAAVASAAVPPCDTAVGGKQQQQLGGEGSDDSAASSGSYTQKVSSMEFLKKNTGINFFLNCNKKIKNFGHQIPGSG